VICYRLRCAGVAREWFVSDWLLVAGGSAYGLIFAGDGTSAILLSEDSAKETNQLGHLPWVTVYYLHRKEEPIFAKVFLRALHAAAARLDLCPDAFTPGASSSGCCDDALLLDGLNW
jgi:hypothetical protein